MDLRQLLGKLTVIEGSMEQAAKQPTGPKYTGQWRGTDAGTPGKKLVGDGIEPEENILKDLSKGPTPKTKEQELAEQFESFLQQLEEESLGVEEKRPGRTSDRPRREYEKTGQPSKRYTPVKEDAYDDGFTGKEPKKDTPDYKTAYEAGKRDAWVANAARETEKADESRGHKVVATKLKDIERAGKPTADDDLKAREAQARADYAKYVAKMKKLNPNYIPLYKMDETVPTGQTTMAAKTGAPVVNDPKQAKAVQQATSILKTATGSQAPATNIAKAIDSASQGEAVNAKDMTALQPMMQDVATIAQDPKLAGQFKSLLGQVQQKQKTA